MAKALTKVPTDFPSEGFQSKRVPSRMFQEQVRSKRFRQNEFQVPSPKFPRRGPEGFKSSKKQQIQQVVGFFHIYSAVFYGNYSYCMVKFGVFFTKSTSALGNLLDRGELHHRGLRGHRAPERLQRCRGGAVRDARCSLAVGEALRGMTVVCIYAD